MSATLEAWAGSYVVKQVIIAEGLPIRFMVDAAQEDASAILDAAIKHYSEGFKRIPEKAQKSVICAFTRDDDADESEQYGIIKLSCCGYSPNSEFIDWANTEFDFNDHGTATVKVHNLRAAFLSPVVPQAVFETFAEVVLSNVREWLESFCIGRMWQHPTDWKNRAVVLEILYNIASEMQEMLPNPHQRHDLQPAGSAPPAAA